MAACFRETSRPWLTVTTVVVTVCIVALSIANAVTSPVDGAKQFARSLSDEFSDAIGNDVAMIATTYALMFVYLLVALSRWDPVHSMIGLSFVVILIVALSYAGCLGLGGLLGVKNNALTNIGLNVLLRSRYSVVLEANRRRRRSTRRRYNTTKFTFRRTRISADVFLFH
jgi:hypothetical protein